MLKALVLGFGSIGRRHATVLEELGCAVAVISRREVDHPRPYQDLEAALNDFKPDYVVIASRTNEHHQDVVQLAELGFAGVLLIEKPLFDHPITFPENSFERVHVAFNMRFHPLLSVLRRAITEREIFAIHAYVGQYLPDWRPDDDYRAGYSAIKAQGGGVLRDLSHELDFAIHIAGGAREVTALGGKLSNLEIDSDDVFSILMRTAHCPSVCVSMNYLDTKFHREFVVHTDKGTLRANMATSEFSDGEKMSHVPSERNESYTDMHRAAMEGDTRVLCGLQEAERVQELIAAIERASAGPEWVLLNP